MTNKMMGAVQRTSANSTGNIVVTYIHTSARKIVLPTAIFLRALKYGWGIFGAEYKKVVMAAIRSRSQCDDKKKKNMIAPESPMKNKIR